MKMLGLSTLLLYIPFVPSFACADTGVDVVPSQIHDLNEDLDLASFLDFKTNKHDGIFSEALKLLESINSSSSCNKLAATKLVTSCKSVGRDPQTPTDSDTYLALEYVRSLYAARLAICEISGAGISIPLSCQPMNVSPTPKKARFSFYTKNNPVISDDDPVRREGLEPCLKSLESRPQWWTSYSNSKQNAMVICHASRSEIEKEDILATYNTILQSSTKLSDGILEALRVAVEESAKGRAFMRSTELLRNEALREMEESTSSSVIRMSHKIETHFTSFMESISSALNAVHIGFSEIQSDLQNSSSEAISLRQMLQYIHGESLLRSEQIAMTQRRNADTQDELALSLKSKLQAIATDDMSRLSQSMGTLDSSLEWLYMRMGDIIEQEEGFSERLSSIGLSLEEFQLRVDSLSKIQERQYEIAAAQAQAQEDLQTDIRISKGILDQTVSTAANLQTTLEAATKWRETSIFGGILGHHTAWIITGAIWAIASQRNPSIPSAAAVMLVLIFVCMASPPSGSII